MTCSVRMLGNGKVVLTHRCQVSSLCVGLEPFVPYPPRHHPKYQTLHYRLDGGNNAVPARFA